MHFTTMLIDNVKRELEETHLAQRELLGRDALPVAASMLAHVQAEKTALEEQERAIRELRGHDERLRREKLELHAQCEVLLEKQRQADQDRMMMGNDVEGKRSKLRDLLKERANLLEERLQRAQEMMKLSASAWLSVVPVGQSEVVEARVMQSIALVDGPRRDKGIPAAASTSGDNARWVGFSAT